jgi:hypothetical protein
MRRPPRRPPSPLGEPRFPHDQFRHPGRPTASIPCRSPPFAVGSGATPCETRFYRLHLRFLSVMCCGLPSFLRRFHDYRQKDGSELLTPVWSGKSYDEVEEDPWAFHTSKGNRKHADSVPSVISVMKLMTSHTLDLRYAGRESIMRSVGTSLKDIPAWTFEG